MTDTPKLMPEALIDRCFDAGVINLTFADLRIIRAALASRAGAVAVVKPLEWVQRSRDEVTADAFGVSGYYRILRGAGEWSLRSPCGLAMRVLEGFETQAEAKAEAQKRHDEVALSAVTIQPATQVQTEAVVCGGKKAGKTHAFQVGYAAGVRDAAARAIFPEDENRILALINKEPT